MDKAEIKYGEVVKFLRRAKPEIKHPEILSEKIIDKIRNGKRRSGPGHFIDYYLFGWVNIRWIRRCMITASVAILILFLYQQSVILKRINSIDRQVVRTVGNYNQTMDERVDTRLLLNRTENIFPARNRDFSEKDLNKLIETLNELQVKYKDLLKLIEDDPDLKIYFEKKLNQRNQKKPNL